MVALIGSICEGIEVNGPRPYSCREEGQERESPGERREREGCFSFL